MTAPSATDSAVAQLEQHKKRIEQLSERRTRLQVKLEEARKQYDQAVQEAEQAYGTADLDQLRQKLADQIAANNAAVTTYLSAINEFEGFLERLERAMVDPELLSELVASLPADAPPAAPAVPADEAPVTTSVSFDEEDI